MCECFTVALHDAAQEEQNLRAELRKQNIPDAQLEDVCIHHYFIDLDNKTYSCSSSISVLFYGHRLHEVVAS